MRRAKDLKKSKNWVKWTKSWLDLGFKNPFLGSPGFGYYPNHHFFPRPPRFVVENRARGSATISATTPTRNNFDSSEPTQNRGQNLQRPVTPSPRPRIPELRPKLPSQPQNGRNNAPPNSFRNFPLETQR